METGEAHVLVRAVGEIDLGTASLLSDQLTEASRAVPSGGALVLDLAPVDFVGSAGLAVLLDHHQRLAAAGIALRVVVTGGAVARVFEITEMASVLTVHESVDGAVVG